jgi:hypothetical protein
MNQAVYNYIPKASEGIGKLVNAMRHADFDSKSSDFIEKMMETAKQGVKFALPVNGRLMEDDFKGLPDGFRLPYPITVAEYATTDDGPDAQAIADGTLAACHRRIVIAQEFDVAVLPEYSYKHTIPPGATHAIYVTVICDLADVGWVPNWSMGIVWNCRNEANKFSGNAAPIPGGYGDLVARTTRENGGSVSAAARADTGHEVTAILELCEALSCSNVRAELVPAPPRLNAKRIKNGRMPLPDYHVLTVCAHKPNGGTATVLGDRSGPRQHLRRGHIRVYQTGLRLWIQPTVVGSAANGMLNKTYRVKP